MGYDTSFRGKFNVVPISKNDEEGIDYEQISEDMEELNDGGTLGFDEDAPDQSDCDWVAETIERNVSGRNELHLIIKWGGGEKFYQYDAWLQFALDKVLLPNGATLQGAIWYWGDDESDHGVIMVKKGKVVKVNASDIALG